jgi:hypothetical protein
MNIENLINFNRIAELIIISSTPSFFYDNMIEEKSIKEITEKLSVNELYEIFNYYKDKIYEKFDNLIIVYSIIFSLIHKDKDKDIDSVRDFFIKLDSYDLRWLRDIKNIYFSRIKSINYIQVPANYSYKVPFSTENY